MSEADETEWPPHLDALVAAPANHRLLHEDDEVRVLEVTVQPGERENLHHHRWPSIMVVLARPDYRNFDADGNEIPHLVERRPVRFCRGPCACHRSGCTQLRSRLTRRTAFGAFGSSSRRPRHKALLGSYRHEACSVSPSGRSMMKWISLSSMTMNPWRR